MTHYIERFECGHAGGQCRCPGPKTVRLVPGKCPECATPKCCDRRFGVCIKPAREGSNYCEMHQPKLSAEADEEWKAAEQRLLGAVVELDLALEGEREKVRTLESAFQDACTILDALSELHTLQLLRQGRSDGRNDFGPDVRAASERLQQFRRTNDCSAG